MRISYILDTFGGGGKERRCLQIIQGLNATGITDIQVVLINNRIEYKDLYKTTAKIEIIDRKTKKLSQIQTAKALYTILKPFKPDIVQAWGLMSAGFVLLVKPFLSFKFLVSYVADNYAPKGLGWLINKICNRVCVKIISNSKAGLKAYETPNSKAVLIYNGFNEIRFHNKIYKVTKKEELNINTEYVVAMVATFWETKNWQLFFDIAKIIVKQRKDITFLAVGCGPQWDFYKSQITKEECSFIKMIGRRDDVDELYQICDVTVLFSTFGEALSNSILESMAWGVPVIASDGGGTPEIISNGQNGILISSHSADYAAKILTDLLDDGERLNQMGKHAFKTVKEHFLLERMTKEYLQLYNKLINHEQSA